jgi:ElaB/YqjD/DUF883 family membrane-anchored ribosome-binding protein
MEKVKQHLWRKDEFVCTTELYIEQERIRRLKLSASDKIDEYDKARSRAEVAIKIVRDAIKKMMRV